ncbi:MAG: hypothetical protein JWM04_505 [Verrucomicrobiales bacterium]|nr:hypothetical protein [Verrucomicrobiales bacterium]
MSKLRVAIFFFALLAVFGLGLLVSRLLPYLIPQPSGKTLANTSTVITQIQNLNELVTIKYVLEKVVVWEDAKWYGNNRVVLIANGIVKAGIDFKQMTAQDVQVNNQSLTLRIPHAIVTDAYLDDRKTQVFENKSGLVRPFDKDLEQEARKQAVGELLKAARSNGIQREADERASLQLHALFSQAGFTNITVDFK